MAQPNFPAIADHLQGIQNEVVLVSNMPGIAGQIGLQHQEMITLMREMRAEMRAEMRGMGAEMRAEMRAEMGEIRAEMRAEMGEIRAEMRAKSGEMKDWMQGQLGKIQGQIEQVRNEYVSLS